MRHKKKKIGNKILHFIEVHKVAYKFHWTIDLKDKKYLGWSCRGDERDNWMVKFPTINKMEIIGTDDTITESIANKILGKNPKSSGLERYEAIKKSLGLTTKREPKPIQKGKMLESNGAFSDRLKKWEDERGNVWLNIVVLIEKVKCKQKKN